MTDFSVWVYFTLFEMEQSLCVIFRVQGSAVSAEVSLHAKRIIACKKIVLGFSRGRLSADDPK